MWERPGGESVEIRVVGSSHLPMAPSLKTRKLIPDPPEEPRVGLQLVSTPVPEKGCGFKRLAPRCSLFRR